MIVNMIIIIIIITTIIKIKYRMAGNFGGEFILADWRF